MRNPLVVNLFAAPGSGKSTMAAGLFYRLKVQSVNAELSGEYAKDLTYVGRHYELRNQIYVFGKQQHRIERLTKDCDVIISDSPLLMNLVYFPEDYPQCVRDTVKWAFNRYDNINFLIHRDAPYQSVGRNQSEEEAQQKHVEIEAVLKAHNTPYVDIKGNDEGLETLVEVVSRRLCLL